MQIQTAKFGLLEIEPSDTFRFPEGLIGFEECRQWALLADAASDRIGWFQSTSHGDIAVAVASPRRFVPDYQVRLTRRQLQPLELHDPHAAQVLVIVGKNERSFTLNLKAPLLLNLERQIGRQVIVREDLPVQFEIRRDDRQVRKTA